MTIFHAQLLQNTAARVSDANEKAGLLYTGLKITLIQGFF